MRVPLGTGAAAETSARRLTATCSHFLQGSMVTVSPAVLLTSTRLLASETLAWTYTSSSVSTHGAMGSGPP